MHSLNAILSVLPLLAASILIAGLAYALVANVCAEHSVRFALRLSVPVMVILLGVGTYFLLRGRRLEKQCQEKRVFKREQTAPLAPGGTVTTDFVAPASAPYRVALFSPDEERSTLPKRDFEVECVAIADGQEVMVVPMSTSQPESLPGYTVAQFQGLRGKSYRFTLQIPASISQEEGRRFSVRFTYDYLAYNAEMYGAMILGGIGESGWLAAYGVFVAVAVRVTLDRQDEIDTRKFLASRFSG